jgi:hypothetical protein
VSGVASVREPLPEAGFLNHSKTRKADFMNRPLFFRMGIFLVCLCLLSVQTQAQSGGPIISKGESTAIIGGIAGCGAAIGVEVYFALTRPPSIKGCAVSGPNGLELKNEGDGKTFHLLGITNDVKPGDRVRVQGKKKAIGKSSSGNPLFWWKNWQKTTERARLLWQSHNFFIQPRNSATAGGGTNAAGLRPRCGKLRRNVVNFIVPA